KLCSIVITGVCSLQAQTANPLSAEVRQSYGNIRRSLLKMAEKMPGEFYAFKPVSEIETFGRRVAHIADANFRTCAGLNGENRRLGAAARTSKADLAAALQESFAYCDRVFDALTDASAVEMVDGTIGSPPIPAPAKRSRL